MKHFAASITYFKYVLKYFFCKMPQKERTQTALTLTSFVSFFYKQHFRTYIKCSHKKARVQFSSLNYLTVFIKNQTLKA